MGIIIGGFPPRAVVGMVSDLVIGHGVTITRDVASNTVFLSDGEKGAIGEDEDGG